MKPIIQNWHCAQLTDYSIYGTIFNHPTLPAASPVWLSIVKVFPESNTIQTNHGFVTLGKPDKTWFKYFIASR